MIRPYHLPPTANQCPKKHARSGTEKISLGHDLQAVPFLTIRPYMSLRFITHLVTTLLSGNRLRCLGRRLLCHRGHRGILVRELANTARELACHLRHPITECPQCLSAAMDRCCGKLGKIQFGKL